MTTSTDLSGQLSISNDVKAPIEAALSGLRRDRIVERIWQKDHTVWKQDSTEISNRLGWLTVAEDMRRQTQELAAFADGIRTAGFKHVVLLGMGGSSLCPEVLRVTFGSQRGYPRLLVLDSTVPDWVRRVAGSIDPSRALFIVSSKSGGTLEVLSFFKHFWDLVEKKGRGKTGDNFIAITDPGTSLSALATQHGFRRTFHNPSDIGGRYSALSYFGLVPAALMGIDLAALLDPALAIMQECRTDAFANPAAWLGAAMGVPARTGQDKLTLVTSPSIETFGLWAEQLIAESTGKGGRGIVPIALEPSMAVEAYSGDRLFVVLRVASDKNGALDRHVSALQTAGQPVMLLDLKDRFDLGAEFFRWEMATAIAGHILDIHPFNQPNVQESKDNTQRVLDSYKSAGALPEPAEAPRTPRTAQLPDFLEQAQAGDYVAVLAYLDESPEIVSALADLRAAILKRYRLPNTLGYGPRFLHSTGQLHKGGGNSGLFIQLTASAKRDVPIPGELFSFGVLASAQAAGDLASLHSHHRRAVRIDLGSNPAAGIQQLTQSIGGTSTPLGSTAAAKKTTRYNSTSRHKSAGRDTRRSKPRTRRNRSR
jgi:glucose-6-phosphate isomerase/transaldolase/glucose-6-phosphate isomerase